MGTQIDQEFPYVLTKFCDVVHNISREAGWWDGALTRDQLTPTKIALIHSEISEALEGFRKSRMDDHITDRTALEIELADAIIRICDLAGAHKLDLGRSIVRKINYNDERADHKPENRAKHGGKKF